MNGNTELREELNRITNAEKPRRGYQLEAISQLHNCSVKPIETLNTRYENLRTHFCLSYALGLENLYPFHFIYEYMALNDKEAREDYDRQFVAWLTTQLIRVDDAKAEDGCLIFYWYKEVWKHAGIWDINHHINSKWGHEGYWWNHEKLEVPSDYGSHIVSFSAITRMQAHHLFCTFAVKHFKGKAPISFENFRTCGLWP